MYSASIKNFPQLNLAGSFLIHNGTDSNPGDTIHENHTEPPGNGTTLVSGMTSSLLPPVSSNVSSALRLFEPEGNIDQSLTREWNVSFKTKR